MYYSINISSKQFMWNQMDSFAFCSRTAAGGSYPRGPRPQSAINRSGDADGVGGGLVSGAGRHRANKPQTINKE
jgi:hypothetical protein